MGAIDAVVAHRGAARVERRHGIVCFGLTVALTMAAPSTAIAQTSPARAPAPNALQTSTPVSGMSPPRVPVLPSRAVVFFPDRPTAQLEFDGVGLVDGVWTRGWFPVCVGPCAQYVPLALRYRVAGPGIDGSRHFEIGPGEGPLYLRAKTGSASGATWGAIAAAVGGTAVVGGLFTAWIAGFCGRDGGIGCDSRSTVQATAVTVAALGAVTLVVGIATAIHSQTIVSGDDAPNYQ